MKESPSVSITNASRPSPIRIISSQIPVINDQNKQVGMRPVDNLSIGQPDLNINPTLYKVNNTATLNEANAYLPAAGDRATLEAISKLYASYYPNVRFKPEETIATLGATGGLQLAFQLTIRQPGDEILTFCPYFAAYQGQVSILGGRLVPVASTSTYKPDLSALEKAIQDYPRAKAIVLNYPNNPSGACLSKEEAEALATLLKKYPHLTIILDDVYQELTKSRSVSLLDIAPELQSRCIVLNSGSKSLAGAPSLRLGMLGCSNPEWIFAMTNGQLFTTCGSPIDSQRYLRAAIDEKLHPRTDWWQKTIQHYEENREFLFSELKKLGMAPLEKPEGAFYMLLDAKNLIGKNIPDTVYLKNLNGQPLKVTGIHLKLGTKKFENDTHIANYFLHIALVAMVPGSGFGLNEKSGQLRISFARPLDELERAMQSIKDSVNAITLTNRPNTWLDQSGVSLVKASNDRTPVRSAL